jgi:hypothetical protein
MPIYIIGAFPPKGNKEMDILENHQNSVGEHCLSLDFEAIKHRCLVSESFCAMGKETVPPRFTQLASSHGEITEGDDMANNCAICLGPMSIRVPGAPVRPDDEVHWHRNAQHSTCGQCAAVMCNQSWVTQLRYGAVPCPHCRTLAWWPHDFIMAIPVDRALYPNFVQFQRNVHQNPPIPMRIVAPPMVPTPAPLAAPGPNQQQPPVPPIPNVVVNPIQIQPVQPLQPPAYVAPVVNLLPNPVINPAVQLVPPAAPVPAFLPPPVNGQGTAVPNPVSVIIYTRSNLIDWLLTLFSYKFLVFFSIVIIYSDPAIIPAIRVAAFVSFNTLLFGFAWVFRAITGLFPEAGYARFVIETARYLWNSGRVLKWIIAATIPWWAAIYYIAHHSYIVWILDGLMYYIYLFWPIEIILYLGLSYHEMLSVASADIGNPNSFYMRDEYGYPLLFSRVTRVATYRGYIHRFIDQQLFDTVMARRSSSAISSDLLRYIQYDVAAEDQRIRLGLSYRDQYNTSVYIYQTIVSFREADSRYVVPNAPTGVQNLRW